MEVLYRHKKGAFNCKLSFPTLLTLIENSSFHFILIFDGVVISSKIRDDSTLWLHICISFLCVLCGKVEKSKNTVLGYKKWSKSKGDIGFESATQTLCILIFTTFSRKSLEHGHLSPPPKQPFWGGLPHKKEIILGMSQDVWL